MSRISRNPSYPGALAIPREARDTITVVGRDRKRWLNGLLTCDVEPVRDGVGAWGLLLNRRGKIQSDVDVLARGEAMLLGIAAGKGSAVQRFLEGFLVMDDVEIELSSARYAWIVLVGPLAVQLAQEVPGAHSGCWAPLGRANIAGASLVVERGELQQTLDSLKLIGRGAVEVGSDADWNRVRLESGLPEFGVDYDDDDTPHDSSLDRLAVSWSKGCYLGQEVVCMQDMRGKARKRIVSVVVNGETCPRVGDELRTPDSEAENSGVVTSVSMSPALGRAVALARVKAADAAPGTLLTAENYAVTVVRSPRDLS